MAPPLTLDDARRVPKVELHLHVESLSSAATIEALADELGVPLLRPRGELYRCDSLAELLEACEWWCDLFRTPEIAEGIAYGAAERLHGDGVVYAEVAAGPRYWPHVPFPVLLPALCAGFDRARRDGLADCRLLPTISRDQPVEWALELVDWIAAAGLPRIAGIGLDGDETATGRTGPCSPRPSSGPAPTASAPPRTRASRPAPRACATRSTCSASAASTTACARSKTRRSSSGSPATA